MLVTYMIMINSVYGILETGERARKLKLSGAIELRGYRDFIFLGQLQKTIRLQLSLFTNYRNSYI